MKEHIKNRFRAAAARLRARGGFSLSELLLTTAILLLTTGIAAQTFPIVRNVYVRAVDMANAIALLNNATVALRNELCLASDSSLETQTGEEDGETAVVITYTNARTGYQNRILSRPDDTVQIEEYYSYEGERPDPRPLLAAASQESGLLLSFGAGSTYDPDSGVFTIRDLSVRKIVYADGGKDLREITALDQYLIRTANPDS